jgi:hypothetical protein
MSQCYCEDCQKIEYCHSSQIYGLQSENARLRDALETLERLSGLPMEYDDPARIAARAALEGK